MDIANDSGRNSDWQLLDKVLHYFIGTFRGNTSRFSTTFSEACVTFQSYSWVSHNHQQRYHANEVHIHFFLEDVLPATGTESDKKPSFYSVYYKYLKFSCLPMEMQDKSVYIWKLVDFTVQVNVFDGVYLTLPMSVM